MSRRYPGSRIAANIERDYKIEQSYKQRQRAKCKEKTCEKCQYEEVCKEVKNDT